MASSDEEQFDQVDLFHAKREKAVLDRESLIVSSSDEDNGCDEVMSLGLSSSDEEREESAGESVAVKNWGKKKANYYAEDSDSENEEELEEKEAIHIQQQFATVLSERDFEMEYDNISDIDEMGSEPVLRDLTLLDEGKGLVLMTRKHPELSRLLNHLHQSLSSLLKKNLELVGCAEEMENLFDTTVYLNLCYSLNVMYYLLLKASILPVESHPVTRILVRLIMLMEKLKGTKVSKTRDSVLMDSSSEPHRQVQPSKNEEEEPLSLYHRAVAEKKMKINFKFEKSVQNSGVEIEPVMGKRAITYQIARNKGIGLKSKRLFQNPRVKHKLKFKKALLKRKSQVLPVMKELARYGGETTGIKMRLARSTKILS